MSGQPYDKEAERMIAIELEAAPAMTDEAMRAALEAKAWWEDAHGEVVLLSDATDALEAALSRSGQESEDLRADIRQASTGGPDFTVKDWPRGGLSHDR